jgi:hypothetical protein
LAANILDAALQDLKTAVITSAEYQGVRVILFAVT